MTQQHTPGPWRTARSWMYQDEPPILQVVYGDEGRALVDGVFGPENEREANAAFIVLACNAHDDLLAACTAAVPRLCQLCFLRVPLLSQNTHQVPDGGITACEATLVRAAIAKATGGQP